MRTHALTPGRSVPHLMEPRDHGGASRLSLYGPLILALFMLATTRWGSYLMPGPPYVGDIAVLALVAHRVITMAGPVGTTRTTDPWLGLAVSGVLLITVAALLAGDLSADALRDAAPFLYAILVFVTVPLQGHDVETNARRLITAFLYFHLLWTTAVLIVPALAVQIVTPGNPEVAVLSIRSDIDSFVNGVAASIGLYRLLSNGQGMFLFAWGLSLVVVSHSRTGLIVTVVLVVCAAGYAFAQRQRGWGQDATIKSAPEQARARLRPSRLLPVALALCLVGTSTMILAPTALERLAGTFQAAPSSEVQAHAAGTTTARLAAWLTLEQWINEDAERSALGAGFGPNIMTASGAGVTLLGTPDPALRAPHNFPLTVWAHLGIMGLVIVFAMIGLGLRLAVRVRRRPMSDVDVLASLLLIGIPLTALSGVILESPFGAIPYFWALGHLGSVRGRRRVSRFVGR